MEKNLVHMTNVFEKTSHFPVSMENALFLSTLLQ